MQKKSLMNRRLEKVYRKSFALYNAFPTFALEGFDAGNRGQMASRGMEILKKPRLTYYGEVNERELFMTNKSKKGEKEE